MKNEIKPVLIIIAVTVLVFIGIVIMGSRQTAQVSQESTLSGIAKTIEKAFHIKRGTMQDMKDLPSSGSHYGDGVGGPGIHSDPVEDGLLVHSLEHGAVVLSYDPQNLTQEQIDQLKQIFTEKFRGKKIMVPRDNMSASIIMTSWGQELKLNEINEEELVNFMTTNNDRGPEKVSSY